MASLLSRLAWPGKSERRHTIETVDDWFMFGGHRYPLGKGPMLTMPGVEVSPVEHSFASYAEAVFKSSAPVYALQSFRMRVFSSVRFSFQRMRDGRPQSLFGTRALQPLERPWAGGTTQDLMRTALMYHDLAGNAYAVSRDGEMVFLRPDWMRVVFAPREDRLGQDVFGYLYYPDGDLTGNPEPLAPGEVAHFKGDPDPTAPWRGMSWLTPVITEFQLDQQALTYQQQFFKNAATPNLAVALKETVSPENFNEFVNKFREKHEGVDKSGKTLFVGGGADVTVVGSDLSGLALRDVTGGFETRLAGAAGVHPAVIGMREGMQGASLNAGNYQAARRSTADGTFHPLWQDICGSFEMLVDTPRDSRLWYDVSGVPFLREDAKNLAEIQQQKASAINTLSTAGWDPDRVVEAIDANDFSLLVGSHSGLHSVQLQPPGTGDTDDGDED